jgi:hypothetical protein
MRHRSGDSPAKEKSEKAEKGGRHLLLKRAPPLFRFYIFELLTTAIKNDRRDVQDFCKRS